MEAPDIPKLPPEGKYIARMVELMDPKLSRSRDHMYFQQVKLEFGPCNEYVGYTIVYTGYPTGLQMVKWMYPDMEKKLWNIQVKHRKHEEHIYQEVNIRGIWDPNEVDYSKSW